MTRSIARREFLRTTSAAAHSFAYAAGVQAHTQSGAQGSAEEVRIGGSRDATGDYPIQALPLMKIVLTDAFWKPKVLTNATVTIPMLAARDLRSCRSNGNVLEAGSSRSSRIRMRVAGGGGCTDGRDDVPAESGTAIRGRRGVVQGHGRRELLDAAIGAAERCTRSS